MFRPASAMKMKMLLCRRDLARSTVLVCSLLLSIANGSLPAATDSRPAERKLLYVAEPGIRDYLEYGGHGVLVFDIDQGHRFVKRIPAAGLDEKGRPLNVKGICANAATKRLYVSTTKTVTCFDIATEKILWEKAYEGGCDRLAISPDGKVIYLPSLEKAHWHVLDALSGEVIRKIITNSGAHNTILGLDGRHAYLAGLASPLLRVSDTRTHQVVREVGPFGNFIRPFRHGCPSHGVGLTPDEKELWLTDAHNSRLHIFDVGLLNFGTNATATPPLQVASITLRDQPGWVTFSLDGRYGYPSTGDVIEVATRKIVAGLKDETGTDVQSEKMLEVDFAGDQPIRAGDQFGLGRVTRP